jgi:hypothetical protein
MRMQKLVVLDAINNFAKKFLKDHRLQEISIMKGHLLLSKTSNKEELPSRQMETRELK